MSKPSWYCRRIPSGSSSTTVEWAGGTWWFGGGELVCVVGVCEEFGGGKEAGAGFYCGCEDGGRWGCFGVEIERLVDLEGSK